MEIRPIDFCDEETYRSFLASFRNDDNPFVSPETTRELLILRRLWKIAELKKEKQLIQIIRQ